MTLINNIRKHYKYYNIMIRMWPKWVYNIVSLSIYKFDGVSLVKSAYSELEHDSNVPLLPI